MKTQGGSFFSNQGLSVSFGLTRTNVSCQPNSLGMTKLATVVNTAIARSYEIDVHNTITSPVVAGDATSKAFNNTLRKCPSCGNHLTSDRDTCVLFFCSPRVENSELPGASGGNDGHGVCTPSKNPLGSANRDMTGLVMVRKGCTVDYYGLRVSVQRVRKGHLYGSTLIARESFNGSCRMVKVVA